MAQKKRRSHKNGSREFLRFSEVRGKIVEQVEVDPDAQAIVIVFRDKTVLSFDLDSLTAYFPSCQIIGAAMHDL